MNILIQQKIQAGFAVALAFLLLTGASAWWSAQRNAETFRAVDHTYQVLDALEDTLVEMLNTETGSRGFAISGDEAFSQPYQTGIAAVQKEFELAKRLTQDNPEQQRRLAVLDPLIQTKISFANEVVRLRRSGDTAGAFQIIASGQGKAAMDEIRRLISEMEKDEKQLLRQRTDKALAATRTTMAIVVFGSLLALGLVGFARVIVRRDFEKLQQAEEALRGSQRRLTLALEAANIGDWELNLKTHAAHRSLKHDQIFGYPELLPEWTYEIFLEHVHPEDRARVDQTFQGSVAAGRDWYFECRIRRQDGAERHIWVRGAIFPNTAGGGMEMVGMVGDITERRHAEDAVRKLNGELADANQELAAFCYSVSHDLRAPLRGIDGFTHVLEEDYGDKLDDAGRGYLARVRAAAQRMGGLIDDLLKLSKITRAEMQPRFVDLSALAREVADALQRREPQRQVRWEIADGLSAQGDPQLLRVALENLLGNAWKFTGKRAEAVIEFGRQERDGQTVFCVRDNGAGFDMAYAKHLFGAFQRMHSTAEFEGTGIGLATVQRVLHRHGGRVWAEAGVDKGAAFYFNLPSETPAGENHER